MRPVMHRLMQQGHMPRCGISCTSDSSVSSNGQTKVIAQLPSLTKIPSQPMHTSAHKRGTAAVSVHHNLILRTPVLRVRVARTICRRVFVLALLLSRLAGAQIDTSSIAPHRYLVLYRNATIPGDA